MSATPHRNSRRGTRLSDADRHYDVIVVGAGPTGLTAANLIAQAGHRVALFERYPTLYNLPRAGHLDNEILRILQQIGCLDAVMEDAYPIVQVPLLDSQGEFLLELVPKHQTVSSFPSVMMYQPVLENALYASLKRRDDFATIFQGWTVEGAVTQHGRSVRVRARARETEEIESSPAGAQQWVEFECRYLIGADGATSSVRQGLGIDREDFGISERWLDIDLAYRRPCHFGPPAIFGDPRRPHFFSPLGKRHHRFECRLFPEESTPEFSTPQKGWELLTQKGLTTKDVEIVRQAVYTFEYRVAQRWQQGRAFLIGDAAHTLCPLLGQGLSSGIRDAANLAWKLDLVLRELAAESVLTSYETERRPHVKAWAELSLLAGDFICITDPGKAAARDAAVRAGGVPLLRPPAMLTAGLFDLSADAPTGIAGQLFAQRIVTRQGRAGLFDDIVGRGFVLLVRGNPDRLLADTDRMFLEQMGMSCIGLSATEDDSRALVDETGEYVAFFEANSLEAVIVRPDRYIFGGAKKRGDVTALLSRLVSLLLPGSPLQSPRHWGMA